MKEQNECNGLTIEDWEFDVFITDSGNIGFTVYKPGDDEHSVDIFVQPDLTVIP